MVDCVFVVGEALLWNEPLPGTKRLSLFNTKLNSLLSSSSLPPSLLFSLPTSINFPLTYVLSLLLGGQPVAEW